MRKLIYNYKPLYNFMIMNCGAYLVIRMQEPVMKRNENEGASGVFIYVLVRLREAQLEQPNKSDLQTVIISLHLHFCLRLISSTDGAFQLLSICCCSVCKAWLIFPTWLSVVSRFSLYWKTIGSTVEQVDWKQHLLLSIWKTHWRSLPLRVGVGRC